LSSDLKVNGGNPSPDVIDVIDELAAARLSARDLLEEVTAALSRHRSGTWVTTLMGKDPNIQLVLSANAGDPSLADYVDEIVAAIDISGSGADHEPYPAGD
jgi:hypothetical protein